MFANTSTGGTGTIATGITVSASNGTRQNAKVESVNGKIYQTMELAITATGNLGFTLPFDPSSAGANMTAPLNIQIGDIYGFEVDYFVQIVSAMSQLTFTAQANLDVRDSVGSGRVVCSFSTFTPQVITGSFFGKVVMPPFVFGDVQANLLNTSAFGLTIFHTAETSGVYKVGVSNVRVVKLNQPVVTL
jgi:hypothetical protein